MGVEETRPLGSYQTRGQGLVWEPQTPGTSWTPRWCGRKVGPQPSAGSLWRLGVGFLQMEVEGLEWAVLAFSPQTLAAFPISLPLSGSQRSFSGEERRRGDGESFEGAASAAGGCRLGGERGHPGPCRSSGGLDSGSAGRRVVPAWNAPAPEAAGSFWAVLAAPLTGLSNVCAVKWAADLNSHFSLTPCAGAQRHGWFC